MTNDHPPGSLGEIAPADAGGGPSPLLELDRVSRIYGTGEAMVTALDAV